MTYFIFVNGKDIFLKKYFDVHYFKYDPQVVIVQNSFVLIKQTRSCKEIGGLYVNFWTKYKKYSRLFIAQFIWHF